MILIWKRHFNFCHFCRSKTCHNGVDMGNFYPDEIVGPKPPIASWPCRRLVVPLSECSLQHYALCSVRFFNGVISPHQECFFGETMEDLLCFVILNTHLHDKSKLPTQNHHFTREAIHIVEPRLQRINTFLFPRHVTLTSGEFIELKEKEAEQ